MKATIKKTMASNKGCGEQGKKTKLYVENKRNPQAGRRAE